MSLKMNLLAFLFILSITESTLCFALEDPTKPADARDEVTAYSANAMQLNAIMIWQHKRLASINGIIVHEGDVFNKNRIIKINSNTVELEGPDGRITLQLLTSPLKRVK